MTGVTLSPLDLSAILTLRTRALRPALTDGELARFEGDQRATTRHYGARLGDEVIACATLILCAAPASVMLPALAPEPASCAYQLRGMAVEQAWRRQGLGAALLEAIELDLEPKRPLLLWCNARAAARSLYERAGFLAHGERFEIEGIGPHWLMSKALS